MNPQDKEAFPHGTGTYQQQYKAFAQQAEQRLNELCDVYLPVKAQISQAARYSLLGGGKRVRAVLCWLPASWRAAIPQLQPIMPRRWKCCTAIP